MMAYSVHADFIPSIKRYQIFVDLRFLMREKINGNYDLHLRVEDPRAINPFMFRMGLLNINFHDGTTDASNIGVTDDY